MKKKRICRVFCSVLLMLMMIQIIPLSNNAREIGGIAEVKAAELLTLQDLMVKFPAGKYWNHLAKSGHGYNGNFMCSNCGNPDGWTNYPCATHTANASVGQYDCNGWYGMQCNGFVRKLATDAYGSMHTSWSKGSIDSVKPGDIIHYYGGSGEMKADPANGHWVMVIAVNGNVLTFGECNSDGHCKITWHRTMNVKATASSYTVYSAPKALAQNVLPNGVTLNKTTATLTSKGSTVSLTATVSPSNATDKSITWKSSNTSVATVSSSGVVTAVANGTATITATTNSGGKKASCNVTVVIPTAGSDGWYYTTVLPSGISSSGYDIQYQNVYQKYATSSPGTGWTDTGVDKKEYTKSGSSYERDTAIQTSDTVKLVEYYYYHYCGPSTAWNDVNYYARDGYVHRDEMHLDYFSVYEHTTGKDLENTNLTWYHLKWPDGNDAYCHRNATGGTCDGSGGQHGSRSPYWYKKYVYQNYTVKTLNQYQKTSAWGTSKDATATTVNIRYRLKPTGVTLNKTTATLTSKGTTVALTATVAPSNAGCKDVTWKSSNTSVATVSSSGVVTAVGNGTATITVTTASGSKTATCNVTVSIATTGVSLNKTSATLNSVGQTVQLTATVAPSNAANKNVTWKSSNTSVATVDSKGLVKAIGNGTATITVTTASGSKTATCNVTVSIATTGVSLNKTSATLNSVGQTVQLTATVAPSNAANKNITWKSSNTSVATVDSKGLVKAIGNGTATITVTTASGSKTATCTVTVKVEADNNLTAFVERMYTVALGRTSDANGMAAWTRLLLNYENDGAGIARGFILSDEFKLKNYSNEEYLHVLYQTFFDRAADAEGFALWMQMLNQGKSREFVLAGFVNSVEFDNLCTSFGISRGVLREDGTAINPGVSLFAKRLYTSALGREGDKQGIEEWSLRISNGACTPEFAAKCFFLSEEYLNKKTTNVQYVQALYRTFMDREADDAGKASWVNHLESGMSREAVLEGFSQSDEFKAIMKKYGL